MTPATAYPFYDPAELFAAQQERLRAKALKGVDRFGWAVTEELWAAGFLPDRSLLYNLGDPDAYLTDIQREMTRLINGRHGFVLNDKLLFASLYGGPVNVARILAFIERGRWFRTTPVRLRDYSGDIYVKPTLGGLGEGVRRYTVADGRVTRDGRSWSAMEFANILMAADRPRIVTVAAQQHSVLDGFYPGSVNTVRVVVVRDQNGPYIGHAAVKVGASSTRGLDNIARGGACFDVDIDTGVVGLGARQDERPHLTTHPETGAQITGVTLPHWRETIGAAKRALQRFRPIVYVGFDIVISPDGPVFLEGNNFTGVDLLQVHKPFLSDPRLRAFYEAHGILAWRTTLPLR